MLRQLKIGRVIKMTKNGTYKINGKISLEKVEPEHASKKDQVTFYANVRINNHIKNKAEALSAIGLYKSQKEAIDEALDYLINSLPNEDKRRLKFQIETLEDRDVRIRGKN